MAVLLLGHLGDRPDEFTGDMPLPSSLPHAWLLGHGEQMGLSSSPRTPGVWHNTRGRSPSASGVWHNTRGRSTAGGSAGGTPTLRLHGSPRGSLEEAVDEEPGMAVQVCNPLLSLVLWQILPKHICTQQMVCAKTVFSSYPTGSLFLWHLLLGLAKTNYVRPCCFSQPCLYNEKCFPVRLSAVVTCCVSYKKCAHLSVSVCTQLFSTWQAYLRMSGFFLLRAVARNTPSRWRTPLPTSFPIRGGHRGSSFCFADKL